MILTRKHFCRVAVRTPRPRALHEAEKKLAASEMLLMFPSLTCCPQKGGEGRGMEGESRDAVPSGTTKAFACRFLALAANLCFTGFFLDFAPKLGMVGRKCLESSTGIKGWVATDSNNSLACTRQENDWTLLQEQETHPVVELDVRRALSSLTRDSCLTNTWYFSLLPLAFENKGNFLKTYFSKTLGFQLYLIFNFK